jgi:ABC-type antimicrobial peptide transport system permease subunit
MLVSWHQKQQTNGITTHMSTTAWIILIIVAYITGFIAGYATNNRP